MKLFYPKNSCYLLFFVAFLSLQAAAEWSVYQFPKTKLLYKMPSAEKRGKGIGFDYSTNLGSGSVEIKILKRTSKDADPKKELARYGKGLKVLSRRRRSVSGFTDKDLCHCHVYQWVTDGRQGFVTKSIIKVNKRSLLAHLKDATNPLDPKRVKKDVVIKKVE